MSARNWKIFRRLLAWERRFFGHFGWLGPIEVELIVQFHQQVGKLLLTVPVELAATDAESWRIRLERRKHVQLSRPLLPCGWIRTFLLRYWEKWDTNFSVGWSQACLRFLQRPACRTDFGNLWPGTFPEHFAFSTSPLFVFFFLSLVFKWLVATLLALRWAGYSWWNRSCWNM